MNPFLRGKSSICLTLCLMFLFITGLCPVFSDDQAQLSGQNSAQSLNLNKQLPDPNKPIPNPNQQLPDPNKPLPNPNQQLPKPNQPLPKPNQQLPDPNKPLPNPNQQLPKPNQPTQLPDKPKAGDMSLQITNDTDFTLSVRASIVDSSERINLTKAKSINLAAHTRGSVVLTPLNTGKVSLSPASTKKDISPDSKILLTVTRGKETRRLVMSYAKSGGAIVLGKDMFSQTHEQSTDKKPTDQSDEQEQQSQKPDSAGKAQIIYVINQTGVPVSYNAILKPANFEQIQGELKPGTNALKFPAKKASRPLSKEKVSLILQVKYSVPGSPTITHKKEALDLESNPTIVLTKTIMGEPVDKSSTKKKLKK